MGALKAQRAAGPAYMPNDGRAVFLTDKAVFGAGGLAAPANGDTIDFLIPAGSRLCDLAFVLDKVDSGATLQASIGYRPVSAADGALAANATYFAAAAAFGQAAGRVECTFKPIKFEQDVYVSITVTAGPAGLAAGKPEIHMIAGVNSEGVK